jgi:hypothetical protein
LSDVRGHSRGFLRLPGRLSSIVVLALILVRRWQAIGQIAYRRNSAQVLPPWDGPCGTVRGRTHSGTRHENVANLTADLADGIYSAIAAGEPFVPQPDALAIFCTYRSTSMVLVSTFTEAVHIASVGPPSSPIAVAYRRWDNSRLMTEAVKRLEVMVPDINRRHRLNARQSGGPFAPGRWQSPSRGGTQVRVGSPPPTRWSC